MTFGGSAFGFVLVLVLVLVTVVVGGGVIARETLGVWIRLALGVTCNEGGIGCELGCGIIVANNSANVESSLWSAKNDKCSRWGKDCSRLMRRADSLQHDRGSWSSG